MSTSPADLDLFLTIVEQVPPGNTLTVETIRDDLDAAQLPRTAWGRWFRVACDRGLLTEAGHTVRCRPSSRKGGRALVYTRTTPQAVPA